MDTWVEWVTFLRGLRGLRGSKHFLRGSTFFVGQNFYVGCVDQNFLRGSVFFMWFKIFCTSQNFWCVIFGGLGLKKSRRFHFNILHIFLVYIMFKQQSCK